MLRKIEPILLIALLCLVFASGVINSESQPVKLNTAKDTMEYLSSKAVIPDSTIALLNSKQ